MNAQIWYQIVLALRVMVTLIPDDPTVDPAFIDFRVLVSFGRSNISHSKARCLVLRTTMATLYRRVMTVIIYGTHNHNTQSLCQHQRLMVTIRFISVCESFSFAKWRVVKHC